MAAGSWIVFNAAKNRLLASSGSSLNAAASIRLYTSSQTVAVTSTGFPSTNWAANTNPANALDSYTSGETALTATGNNYRFDISATSQWTATGGSIVAKYAVLNDATGNIIAYCDLNTSTSVGVTVTSGNTLTISYPTSGVFLFNGATS